MNGKKIPDTDHISRYCSPIRIVDGQIQASAFVLREKDESLSVNWLESLGCTKREEEITGIREIYSKTLNVRPSAKIAILNVGETKEYVEKESSDNRKIEVKHEPIDEIDPTHSGIYNLRPDCELIAELILQTVKESHPACRIN